MSKYTYLCYFGVG